MDLVDKQQAPDAPRPVAARQRPGAPAWPLLSGVRVFANMRVLNGYLTRTISTTFGMCLLVMTFFLIMGSFVKIFELIFKKFSVKAILLFLAFALPSVICYALPFSMAAAALLMFSRLSADGEITAMKANGVSVFRIALPCVLVSALVALIAAYAYNNVLPYATLAQRNVLVSYELKDPSAMIETGSWIPIGRYRCLFDTRDGSMYRNILIIEDIGGTRSRSINAERGYVKYIRHENKLLFELYEVTSEERSTEHTNSYLRMNAGRVDMYVNMNQFIKQRGTEARRKPSHFTTAELRTIVAEHDTRLRGILERTKRSNVSLRAALDHANLLWDSLQEYTAWRTLLSELKRTRNTAFVDLVARDRYNEYYDKLVLADGKHSAAAEALKQWRLAWMPVHEYNNTLEYRSRYAIEISYRLSYAVASIAFAIIGIPLGIRAHRSEKTIGFLICLALIAVHYSLVIGIKSFGEVYTMRPDLLIWAPDILFAITGIALLWRIHHYS